MPFEFVKPWWAWTPEQIREAKRDQLIDYLAARVEALEVAMRLEVGRCGNCGKSKDRGDGVAYCKRDPQVWPAVSVGAAPCKDWEVRRG